MRGCLGLAVSVLALGCSNDVELVRGDAAMSLAGPTWQRVASPTAVDLHDVFVAGRADVWAVGDAGTVLHLDDRGWQRVPLQTTARLNSVYAVSGREVWVVGEDPAGEPVVFRGDGQRWVSVRPMTRGRARFRGLWGGAAELWLVGGLSDSSEPALWRYDGAQWRPEMLPQPLRNPEFFALRGNAAGALWAVGGAGLSMRSTASGWSLGPPPPRDTVFSGGLCVNADGVPFVATAQGAVLTLVDALWRSDSLAASAPLGGLYCDPSGEVIGVGPGGRVATFDGVRWREVQLGGPDLEAVSARDRGEVWAVGARGTLVVRRVAP